jgi:hypothetical protein
MIPYFLLSAAIAGAAVEPRQNFWSDTSQRVRPRALEFMQASSQDLGWAFTNGTSAMSMTGIDSVLFIYAPTNKAWSVTVTGSVETAASGKVLVRFTPSNLNTNGEYEWVMKVSSNASVLAYAYGDLRLITDPSSGITNALTTSTYVDWSLYTYGNTSTEGPYRFDSGFTYTTNGDGSITVSAVSTSITVSVASDSPINIATSGLNRTFSFDGSETFNASGATNLNGTEIRSGTVADARIASTIARDSEVDAATGLVMVAVGQTNDALRSEIGVTGTAGIAYTDLRVGETGTANVAYTDLRVGETGTAALAAAKVYTDAGIGSLSNVVDFLDGITWTSRDAPETNSWKSIAYGNGTFVAVSQDGTHRVMTSPDGTTWTVRDAAEANTWQGVTYGNGMFVAVAADGTHRVMTSPDGVTWTARDAAHANPWYSVTYGNGTFVATASTASTNQVMTSPDGITWTARAAILGNWGAVTYGNGKFVSVAYSGANRAMTSPDGITWTARTAAEANLWYSVTYGNGKFVAVGSIVAGTYSVMTSPDGVTWTSRTAAEDNTWYSVAYGNGMFVAVANDGTHRVMTSPDGITWTARTEAEANTWQGVAYGNGMFVSVAIDGTYPVMTSGRPDEHDIPDAGVFQGPRIFRESLQLGSGAAVTNFSTDGTLADNSDTAVPTEQAVKTYVDVQDTAGQTYARNAANLTNVPWSSWGEIFDPTNDNECVVFSGDGSGSPCVLTQLYVRTMGSVTGMVYIYQGPRDGIPQAVSTVDAGIILDEDGTVDATFDGFTTLTNDYVFKARVGSLSAFVSTNRFQVFAKGYRP